MAKHKDFTKKVGLYPNGINKEITLKNSNNIDNNIIQIPPTNTIITFPKNTTARRSFDFHKFYEKNCDEIVFACQNQIQFFLETSINTNGNTLSIATIVSYCREGISSFLPYCAVTASTLGRVLTLTDINKSLIEKFIEYLKKLSINRSTPRTYYTSIKQILFALGKKAMVSQDIFPRNPYPNSNRIHKGEIALSSKERLQLAYALKSELKILLAHSHKEINSYDASICLLAIAMRTGRNTTPLLELSINCLQEHPLKPDRKLLITYKRRDSSTHLTTLRKCKSIQMMATVMPDVDAIVLKLIELSEPMRELAPKQYQQRLFLYKKSKPIITTEKTNAILPVTVDILANAIKKLIRKHNLINDDGKLLKLNVSRLRKTFVNRLWKLSGNDPFVTAKLAGHTLKVSNDHYLEVSEEMVKDWKLMGEIRTAELLENKNHTLANNSLENTPVGHCKDTKFGHLAPKNGEYCSNFLGCFRCPSYVITSDDLYRLFSFYWLLVREREQIGVRKWSQYYAHIIRIIDRQIAPQFEPNQVAQSRSLAKVVPHPFWRNHEQLLESI